MKDFSNTDWDAFRMAPEFTEKLNEIANLASIGAAWRKDSSLEKWFPLTALELAGLRPRYKQLYELVELYLCTPNTDPAIEDHYKNLVAWFVRNKRPDGSEPRPVAPEQNYL